MAKPLLGIAVLVALVAAAFAYTAGLFSSTRLTPDRFLAQLQPAEGPSPGHRRNHLKGICFVGDFEASGAGTALSRAAVFKPGHYPVVGRFNLADTHLHASDAMAGVRGMSIQITAPDGEQWRSAMIDAPMFPVATPQAFHELLGLGRSKDPQALPHFAAAHPEFAAFGALSARLQHTASYAQDQYNSIDSFIFTDGTGEHHAVRWAVLPAVPPEPKTQEQLNQLGPDFLFADLRTRQAAAPLRFTVQVVVASPGDPTAEPSKAWPADRQHVDVGVITVQQIQDEANARCRDVNYDPTVLPDGMQVSDDPFLAARSAVYARSYELRTAEDADYPRTAPTSP
ncbi:MAG TPA: catalase family peroxidase [Steroidobacteraceae bacterium]|nr:catalase family peroxidase [Steroidobacteraceae bacterium]